jgi:uncharacterized protein with PQ loop repeat
MSAAVITEVISIRAVTLIASSLGVVGPAAQLLHVLRSKSTQGLSRTTFTILTVTFMLSLLLGIQYKVGPALVLATASVVIKWMVLARISWRNALVLLLIAAMAVAIVMLSPPLIAQTVLSQRYSELVAFAWGLLFAITFIPQVLVTRRSRNTRNLSLIMLTLSVGSVSLWTLFAVLVSNYSMLFWLIIVLISLVELVRLKLLEASSAAVVSSSSV